MFPVVSGDVGYRRIVPYRPATRPSSSAMSRSDRPRRTLRELSTGVGRRRPWAGRRLGWRGRGRGHMYVPGHFAADEEVLGDLLRNHGAADLVTRTDDGLVATMLPFIYV